MKHKTAKGHAKKHAGSGKHGGTGKHHQVHHKPAPGSGTGGAGGGPHGGPPNVVAKHPHHPKARGLALGEAWPCCAVEAVAASLRLAGGPVSDADVLALHRYAGGTADAGVPLLVALEAAADVGLAGARPLSFTQADPSETYGTPLILGAELPGSHAVLADAGTWWSWGELYCPCEFPGAVIEEAWSVRWAA